MEDQSVYELLLSIGEAGFEWEALPSTTAARQKCCYIKGGMKKWFTPGHTVERNYLVCLWRAETLWPLGIEYIPRSAKPNAYIDILQGRQPQLQLKALEEDVERDRPPRSRGRGGRGAGRGRSGLAHERSKLPLQM